VYTHRHDWDCGLEKRSYGPAAMDVAKSSKFDRTTVYIRGVFVCKTIIKEEIKS
jgi:hypothetical protein